MNEADLFINTIIAIATIISLIFSNYAMFSGRLSYLTAKVEDLSLRVQKLEDRLNKLANGKKV